MKKGQGLSAEEVRVPRGKNEPAVVLYSGGTTGITKGILLSNLNFNALGAQVVAANPIYEVGDKMLSIMPMFHGFGLGVSIHTILMHGGTCILVPQFTPKTYADLLRKHKPNFIAGVPTLYEALLRVDGIDDLDLSCLKGVFSGGDSLSVELKKRFDAFLKAHGAKITVREGYGTTECVTASCLTPIDEFREGSIGIPFPDTYYKIVRVGTEEEVPYGEEGEICEYVHMSCVIGVKDPYKMQKVKAFVMLKPGVQPSDEVKKALLDYCRTRIAKYAMPYDIEFRSELPKTLVGKVAYRVLEEEEQKKEQTA